MMYIQTYGIRFMSYLPSAIKHPSKLYNFTCADIILGTPIQQWRVVQAAASVKQNIERQRMSSTRIKLSRTHKEEPPRATKCLKHCLNLKLKT